MRDRISEIYAELRDMDIPPQAWALFAELNNLNMMHPDHLAAETKRAKDRERKRASKDNSADSVERPIILDNNLIPEGGCGGKPHSAIPRKPIQHLEAVLDRERAAAVVEHRQKIRKPLTNRAAMLLAADLAKAPDPNKAADLMVKNGWQGFDVSWLKNGKDPPPFTPSGPRRTWAEIRAEREKNG